MLGVSIDSHLARLGHHVINRRVALGYKRRAALADELDFDIRVLADIEKGSRRASPGTYAMLENKLLWEPGSVAAVLEGGEPTESKTPPPDMGLSMSDVSDAALLNEVAARLAAFRRLMAGHDSENWPPPSWQPKDPGMRRRQDG